MVADAEARIVTVNPAFDRITGWSADEVTGKNPRVLGSDRHPPEFFAEMYKALEEQGFWNGEIWNRRKSGDVYPQRTSINVVTDGHGKIVNYVTLLSDNSDARRHLTQMEHLALHDALTGLPNRLLAYSRLEHALRRATRNGHRVAVLFVDLDGFKPVSDRLGHHEGDRLLEHVAQGLVTTARNSDTVARIGGDEFLVVVDELDQPADAVALARRRALASPSIPITQPMPRPWCAPPIRPCTEPSQAEVMGPRSRLPVRSSR